MWAPAAVVRWSQPLTSGGSAAAPGGRPRATATQDTGKAATGARRVFQCLWTSFPARGSVGSTWGQPDLPLGSRCARSAMSTISMRIGRIRSKQPKPKTRPEGRHRSGRGSTWAIWTSPGAGEHAKTIGCGHRMRWSRPPMSGGSAEQPDKRAPIEQQRAEQQSTERVFD